MLDRNGLDGCVSVWLGTDDGNKGGRPGIVLRKREEISNPPASVVPSAWACNSRDCWTLRRSGLEAWMKPEWVV